MTPSHYPCRSRHIIAQLAKIPGLLQQVPNAIQAEVATIPGGTVKEAALKGMVFLEICGWFYVGEIIGRRSLFGYSFD